MRVIRLAQGTLFSETVGAVLSILDWEARGHPVSIGAAISLRARQVLAEAKNKVTDKARGVGAAAGWMWQPGYERPTVTVAGIRKDHSQEEG